MYFFKKSDDKISINSRFLGPCSDTRMASLVKRDRHPSEIFVTLTVDGLYKHRVQRREGNSRLTIGL